LGGGGAWPVPAPLPSVTDWDAVINKKNCCIGIGIIACDYYGFFFFSFFFLGICSFSQRLVVDPKEAEATLNALIFSKEVSFLYIIL
jgi:hypothetical protein